MKLSCFWRNLDKEKRPMKKVALVCGPGGHLTEMLLLKEAYATTDHFFITFDRENTKDLDNAYLLSYNSDLYSSKAIIPTIQLYLEIARIISKEQPDAIISTGGGAIALPAFLSGKLIRSKLIYIEHIGRFDSPSKLGKVLYHLSDRFFVQNLDLLQCYGSKAEYHGGVI